MAIPVGGPGGPVMVLREGRIVGRGNIQSNIGHFGDGKPVVSAREAIFKLEAEIERRRASMCDRVSMAVGQISIGYFITFYAVAALRAIFSHPSEA